MRSSLSIAILLMSIVGARAESQITKISLERTACFGSCPVYEITVDASGEVQFDGKNFVREKGRHRGTISPDDFARLVKKIEQINFFSLKAGTTARTRMAQA